MENTPPLFTVEPIEEADVEQVMKLLKKTFFVDEPLNEAVGLCSEGPDSCPELEQYCAKSLLSGLSFKAVNKTDGIIAVIINAVCHFKEQNEDSPDLETMARECRNVKFQKILQILVRRDEGCKLPERYPDDDKLVEVKIAATDPAWRQRGLMNALVEKTEVATRALGIRLLRMDTSSKYSAKCAERLGFTCIYSAPYESIQLNNQPIILPPPPHEYDKVFMKELVL